MYSRNKGTNIPTVGMTENERKHKLFKMLLYSAICTTPDELWEHHRADIEQMRNDVGYHWSTTDWVMMMRKYGDGPVYEWVRCQAREIWQNGSSAWYESNVRGWLERINEKW